MIRLESVTLAPGGEPLLLEATYHLRPGEKVGLVGRNGTGKTTLLRCIVGEIHADEGQVRIRPNIRLGYLPQQAVSGSSRPVWEEARAAMGHLTKLRKNLEAAEAAAAAGQAGAAERLDAALEAFRVAGGFSEEETIGEVLHGLGFAAADWHKPCDTFSGGWQMRIALAKLLLSAPDVALLDEPTNHLDLLARSWLASFLAKAPFAALIVSHDRHLLDAAATRILEIRGFRLHEYSGNFTSFLQQRELRIAQQQAAVERQQEEIARLQRFIDRFGAKATKASQARSRQKRLDKMELLEIPEASRLPRLTLPPAPPGDFEAITLQKVDLAWPDSPPVLRGVDLILERGQRVAVLGPNGAGKSTLLAALSGELRPLSGRRRVGDRIRIGVFTQDLAAALPADKTPLEVVQESAPMTPTERIRSILGALGLQGEAALRPISQLSGGEKARVALAGLVARPANALLLDEPTNHLDTETVEVLVRALREYEGSLLLVTHDRYLVESLATHVARVDGDRLDVHIGVRPEDLTPRRLGPKALLPRAVEERAAGGTEDWAARKQRQREQQRLQRRIQEVEAQIEKIEAEIAGIDEAMCRPGADYAALGESRAAASARLAAQMAEWEGLMEEASA